MISQSYFPFFVQSAGLVSPTCPAFVGSTVFSYDGLPIDRKLGAAVYKTEPDAAQLPQQKFSAQVSMADSTN